MLELWGTGSACLNVCSLGTISVPDPTTKPHEARLKLKRTSATDFLVTVFLDGDAALVDVPISFNSGAGPFAQVGFSGSIGGNIGNPYPPGTHKVDNFEVTYSCLTCAASFGDDPGPVEQDASEGI